MRTLHAQHYKLRIKRGQMKSIWLVTLLLIIMILFGACQTAPVPQTTEVITQPVVEGEVFPPPLDTPVPPAFLNPAYQDNDEIKWWHAQAMIMNGEVERVVQTHALKVTLFLKDGRALVTVEPEIDEVLKVIKLCDEKCVDIVVATE